MQVVGNVRMPLCRPFLVVAVSIVVLMPARITANQQDPVIPKALSIAIKSVAPNAVLVRAQDVDATCGHVREAPGLVRADFNGDGRDDYAALLKTDTGKEKSWDGRVLREARFSFVLFLDDGNGAYKSRVVRRYEDFIPTTVVLDLQPAGDVRHRETRKNVKLPHPGVTLSFCEQSATTYFMVAGKIRSVPIAD